jgi:hypothetical protein
MAETVSGADYIFQQKLRPSVTVSNSEIGKNLKPLRP